MTSPTNRNWHAKDLVDAIVLANQEYEMADRTINAVKMVNYLQQSDPPLRADTAAEFATAITNWRQDGGRLIRLQRLLVAIEELRAFVIERERVDDAAAATALDAGFAAYTTLLGMQGDTFDVDT